MQQLDYKSIAGLVDAAQAAGEAVSAVVLRQQAAELSQYRSSAGTKWKLAMRYASTNSKLQNLRATTKN